MTRTADTRTKAQREYDERQAKRQATTPCCDRPHSEESPCWDVYRVHAPASRGGGQPWDAR